MFCPTKNPTYSFPMYCVLGHVLSCINPLDGVDSWKEEVVQRTKTPRSVDPRKSKPRQTLKKTANNKKIY